MEKENSEITTNEDMNEFNLIEQYKILYSTHRDTIEIYNKATGFWLLLSIATLGFIFKSEIKYPLSQIISGIVSFVGVGWIVGNVLMIVHLKRLEVDLKKISSTLKIKYLHSTLYPTRVGQIIAFITGIPIVFIFLVLVFKKL